jgi:hypothetical protein
LVSIVRSFDELAADERRADPDERDKIGAADRASGPAAERALVA